MKNSLYYGDCLNVLHEFPDRSVDLIYLDPPFNSKATYNVLFKSPKGEKSGAQIEAFDDTWHWGEQSEREFDEILRHENTDVGEIIEAIRRFLGENDMMAYLTMMASRLLEMHRVLKDTGSLYLHCDPTASHYLKIVLDGVFGVSNYRNEIVWKRTNTHNDSKTWSRTTDIIFFYSKSKIFVWNTPRDPLKEAYVKKAYRHDDGDGRLYRLSDMTSPSPRPNMMYDWKGFPYPERGWRYSQKTMANLDKQNRIWYPTHEDGSFDTKRRPRRKRYLDESSGGIISTIWSDISPIGSHAHERLGYPTQKPVALLERIINASSNEGDIILDPFCGCGTAIEAAQKLGRKWIGIDITHLAISLIENRIKNIPEIAYEVYGTPKDLAGAQDLAKRDKYQFEWWVCSLVKAQPYKGKKKGSDGGIDGLIWFQDSAHDKPKKIIVSVKGGKNVGVSMIRDLKSVVEREKATIGLFVTLTPPTRNMSKEATAAGFYLCKHNEKNYAKIQILSIEGLLNGTETPQYLDFSSGDLTHKKLKRKAKPKATPLKLS